MLSPIKGDGDGIAVRHALGLEMRSSLARMLLIRSLTGLFI
jgi:hypothetical protein